ncbi:SGNH/GDSL hydrolase family protein [Mesorhizobium sp. f-mel]
MVDLVASIFRDYVIDGVPSSGPNKVEKSKVREWGTDKEDRIDALETSAGGLPALTDRVAAAEEEIDDHETRIDNVESLITIGARTPVAVATVAATNIAVVSGIVNGATIGGYVVSTGQAVLLTAQTAPAENGVYIVAAAGAASRSTDFDTSAEFLGATFSIDNGTEAGSVWAVRNTAAIVVGTDAITISRAYDLPGSDAITGVTASVDTLAQIEGLSIATAKLTEAAGSITPLCFRSYTFATATTYEHVVVAKAAERRALQLFCNGAGAGFTVNFDLVDGTSSGSGANFVSSAVTALGAGWYECKAVFLTSGTPNAQVQARISSGGIFPYTGDGTSGMYVRSIVLRLQNTTTNLFPSSDPTNAAFTKTSLTAANTTTVASPTLPPTQTLVDSLDILTNGRLIADKIIEPVGSSSPVIYHTVSLTAGDAIVFDVVAKGAERTRLNLFSNSAFSFNCTFDLANGTSSGTGASIQALGNGWYRCRVSGAATATASANFQHRLYPASGGQPYVGDGTSGIYLQSSSITRNGGANILAFSTNYSLDYWTKSAGVTVSANSGLYLGLLSNPTNIGGSAYDDGRAALVGKKWAALGSSITAQAQYTAPLASSSGMVLTNLGVSGAALGVSTTGYASEGIYNAIASVPADSEIVTLEAGINDFGAQEVVLGTIADSTTATFYGALWAAVVAIRAQAPSAKIIFITPYSGGPSHATHRVHRVNGQGNTLDQFQKAVRDVANLSGYPCIDIAGRSGIGYFTSATYMSDELHINATGGTRYANCALDDLRELSRAGFFGT